MSWRRFFRRAAWDAERRAELDAHLAHEIDDNLARGMSPDAARTAAHRKLGNPALIREDIYRMNTIRWIESVWQDARYAVRVLRRSRAFAVVAILSLTLGIGANTAIFGLIEAVRLRTLPVRHPESLVAINVDSHGWGRTGEFVGRFGRMSNPLWERLREDRDLITEPFAWGVQQFDLADGGESQPVDGLWVSGEFFGALGTSPAAGRLIRPDDDRRGCPTPVAVLSHGFWQRQYGGAQDVVGRTLRVYGVPMTIAGVSEQGFTGLDVGRSFDVAIPICAEAVVRPGRSRLDRADAWWLVVMARLAPGTTVEALSSRLAARSAAVFTATAPTTYTTTDRDHYLQFTLTAAAAARGLSGLRAEYSQPLWLLLGIAGAVLVIACGNLANLMLARARAREREIAVRLAIGASRFRVLRQLVVESVLLSAIGAVLGAALAGVLGRDLVALIGTPGTTYFVDLELNWRVLGCVGLLALLTSALFGVLPAIRAARTPARAMLSGTRGASEGRERVLARRVLVVGQVALSLVLLVGALLFVVTLRKLQSADTGMHTENVVVAEFDSRRSQIPDDRRAEFERQFLQRLAALPGVEAASPVAIVPMNGNGWNDTVVVDGKPSQTYPNINRVGPDFFKALGIPLLAGRTFSDEDGPGTPRVAIVSEAFGRTFFNTPTPLNQEFRFDVPPGDPNPSYRIVGVVRNTKYSDSRDDFGPLVFLADSQATRRTVFLSTVLRTRPGATLTPSLIAAARDVDPRIVVSIQTIDDQIQGALVRERLMATLSTFFGGLATLLAAVGLYGLMAYLVLRRRFEIGLRLALGAEPRTVLSMMIRESAMLVAIGLVIGAGLAWMTTGWAATLLFQLNPKDPVLLVTAALGLAALALTASFVPALRAARVDPTTALRSE